MPRWPVSRARACCAIRDQATFNPGRYLNALAEAIVARGGKLYADTVVSEVEEKDGGVFVRTLNGETIQGGSAVVATNSPINDRFAIHSKMAPYRTYAMCFTIPKDSLPDALFWDTMDPYHYIRQETGPGTVNYLITGGEDHKSGEADDAAARYDGLEAWTRKHFPMIGKETHRWSGQWLETIDFCSFTGVNPGNTQCLCAHRRQRPGHHPWRHGRAVDRGSHHGREQQVEGGL